MMKCWCLSDCGVSPSTKEQLNRYLQLNRSLLWEVNVTCGIWKQCKRRQLASWDPLASFGPASWNEDKREAWWSLRFMCSPLVWEKRAQCSQRWALNEPEVIKTAGKVFIPSGKRKKKQGGRGRHIGSLFHSWAPGPALAFHPSQDQPSPFTPARTSPRLSLQLRSLSVAVTLTLQMLNLMLGLWAKHAMIKKNFFQWLSALVVISLTYD